MSAILTACDFVVDVHIANDSEWTVNVSINNGDAFPVAPHSSLDTGTGVNETLRVIDVWVPEHSEFRRSATFDRDRGFDLTVTILGPPFDVVFDPRSFTDRQSAARRIFLARGPDRYR
jgi:hypothetical protein